MPYKINLFDTEYDSIGTGCMALDFIGYQLQNANGQDIEIDISSLGGSHFDAVAIYDLLKKYPGNVTTKNVSIAGSAASTVFAAGTKRIMSKYSLLMIHPASMVTQGDAKSITSDSEMLDKCTGNVIAIWADVTGLEIDKVTEMVNETTWLSADEALALGFCTDIEDYANEEVSNAALVLNSVEVAPLKYKQIINHILVKQPPQAQTENKMTDQEIKDLVNGNKSALDKVFDFFKTSAKKVVTNKGDIFFVGTLGKGVRVFNSADLETPANDDDVEVESSGKKVKMSVKNGMVENLTEEEKADQEDEDEDDLDAENKALNVKSVLNSYGISTKKAEGSKKIMNASIRQLVQNTVLINSQNELIAELKDQLGKSNTEVQKTKEEIKDEIISSYKPQNSGRQSRSSEQERVPNIKKPVDGSLAANAAKMAVQNQANKI